MLPVAPTPATGDPRRRVAPRWARRPRVGEDHAMTDHADDVDAYLADPGPFGPLLETRLRLVTWNIWWRYGP